MHCAAWPQNFMLVTNMHNYFVIWLNLNVRCNYVEGNLKWHAINFVNLTLAAPFQKHLGRWRRVCALHALYGSPWVWTKKYFHNLAESSCYEEITSLSPYLFLCLPAAHKLRAPTHSTTCLLYSVSCPQGSCKWQCQIHNGGPADADVVLDRVDQPRWTTSWTSSNSEESLPAIQLAEKAQHFCLTNDLLWMASMSELDVLCLAFSCGHWLFKAVTGSLKLKFCLIYGIRIATSMPCQPAFLWCTFETSLNCNTLPIMYTGSLRRYVKYFLVLFCPGIQKNCPFTGVTLLTEDA